MANLYSGIIKTNGKYKKLSEATGVTFTSGTTYTIQIQNMAYVREGTEGEGFLINSPAPFQFKASGSDLYIKVNSRALINIAE